MAKQEIDVVTGTATTGHEWDGIKELNTPLPRWWVWVFYATIVWSVRLLDRLSGLAAGFELHQGRLRLLLARRRRRRSRRAAESPRRQGGRACECRSRRHREGPGAALPSPAPRARPRSATIARPATAPARPARKATPTSTMTTGCGAVRCEAIYQTIEYGIRSGHAQARESQMPAFGKDGMLKRDEIVPGRELCALAGGPAGAPGRRPRRRQEDLRRQLRRLPRRRRQGQPGARRPQSRPTASGSTAPTSPRSSRASIPAAAA